MLLWVCLTWLHSPPVLIRQPVTPDQYHPSLLFSVISSDQSRTAGSSPLARSPQCSPTGYLEIEPFVAGSYSIAAATFMQVSSSRAIFQHSLWLSLHLRNMGLQLLHMQDLWRTFDSSIYLSWQHRTCSPSQAFPSCLTGETNVTSSCGCTCLLITGTSAFSPEFQIWSLDLWCSRGDCSSVSRLLLYVTAAIMLTPAVLYSLEQHFWAAGACLSMPTALLLLHTLFPEILVADTPWVPWISEVSTQVQVCSTSWQDLLGRQLSILVSGAVHSPHGCQLCQGHTTMSSTGG